MNMVSSNCKEGKAKYHNLASGHNETPNRPGCNQTTKRMDGASVEDEALKSFLGNAFGAGKSQFVYLNFFWGKRILCRAK